MSPEQESTAVRAPAPTGRWRGWYGARIGLNLALLAGGWAAFAILGESWWQLAVAVYLAVVSTLLAFVGHDAGHRQIFRSWTPTSASPRSPSPPARPAPSTGWSG